MRKKLPDTPRAPIVWPRAADRAALAAFDPNTKLCTMNCGPHRDDPRDAKERQFLCDECIDVTPPPPPPPPRQEAKMTQTTAPAVELAPDADPATCARRERNFAVRAEPSREPDFVGEKTIYTTHNGRQEYPTPLAPHEARKLFDLLAAEFGFGAPAQALPCEPDGWRENVASQCDTTATSDLAACVMVDGGSGTLRELLRDAARAIRSGSSAA